MTFRYLHRFSFLLLFLYFTAPGAEPAPSEPLIDLGQKIYERSCSGCHSLDHNRVGPRHRTVFGRKAGVLPDYPYSDALINAEVVWTEETLNRWLADPVKMIPGTSMGFSLSDAKKRKAVIEYLKSLTNIR